jgi:hypothetical protein
MIAELNRLAVDRRPRLPDGFSYPLNLSFAMRFLNSKPEERQAFIRSIEVPSTESPQFFVSEYLEYLCTHRELPEITESSMNILAFFGDSMVQNFFGTHESTLDIGSLINDRMSIFCRLPTGTTLSGAQIVGTYLTTALSRAGKRRPAGSALKPYTFMFDEFHHFCDDAFARDTVELRNHDVRIITAHQTMSQPPFSTEMGRNLLSAIQGNSDLKAVFTLDRSDAEEMSKRVFKLTQNKIKEMVRERMWGSSESSGGGSSTHDMQQQGTSSARTWNWDKPSESSRWTDADHSGTSHSSGRTESWGSTTSESTRERKVFYTSEEEREQTVNRLQELSPRHFIVSAGPLAGIEGVTLTVPDNCSIVEGKGTANVILELQRQRFYLVRSPERDPQPSKVTTSKMPTQSRFKW